MELIIPFDILRIIFSFLDKKSIFTYDTSLLSKDRRYIFLEVLKVYNGNIKNICEWTYLRNIKIKTGLCPYYNNMFIPETCERLIISSGSKYKLCRRLEYFDIVNHNIKYLHVDLFNSYCVFATLKAKNLEILRMIHCENNTIFKNIKNECPKLKKIILIGNYTLKLEDYSGIEIIIKSL